MNVTQIRPDISPQTLSDEELLMAHMTMHAYYKEFRLGRGKEHWDLETVVETHDEIREEIELRDNVEHDYISALDNEAVNEVQAMEVEMAHKEDAAKEWAKELLQADDVDQHIRENPPSADWFLKAVEFVEQEDPTLDLTEYVSFAAKSPETLENGVGEWVQEASDADDPGVVGYYLNDQTETGVLFLKEGIEYVLYADTLPVERAESQTEVLESYNQLVRLVQDGARAERARNIIKQQDSWTVPSDPDSYDLADPNTDWSSVDTSMSAYLNGEDADADSWEDADADVRRAITSYHSASASGNPADSFSDLWGPHHRPGGDVVYNGVVAAKAANSGARSDPDTPTDIRDDIESHLNGHIREFADEFEDIEPPDTDQMFEQQEATIDLNVWATFLADISGDFNSDNVGMDNFHTWIANRFPGVGASAVSEEFPAEEMDDGMGRDQALEKLGALEDQMNDEEPPRIDLNVWATVLSDISGDFVPENVDMRNFWSLIANEFPGVSPDDVAELFDGSSMSDGFGRDQALQWLENLEEQANFDQGTLYLGEIVNTSEEYRWYVWSGESEADEWLRKHDFDASAPTEEDSGWLAVEVDERNFDEYRREWKGNQRPPDDFDPDEDVPVPEEEDDPRPVLFNFGIGSGEDESAVVSSIWFQIEPPEDAGDANTKQGILNASIDLAQIIDTSIDFYWYMWDRTEIETWLQEQDLPLGQKEQDGDFVRVNLHDPEKYDKLWRAWQGRRTKPSDGTLAGGEKPRRVVLGETSEGEQERQAIEFLVRRPTEQMAKQALNDMGYDDSEIREKLTEVADGE